MAKVCKILWNQFHEILENKIKADKKFAKVETGSGVIKLLEISIEMICMSRDTTRCYPLGSPLAEQKVQSFG